MAEINSWLRNPDFIANMNFPDNNYLQELLPFVGSYLKRIPIPSAAAWSEMDQSIIISVGKKRKFFRLSPNIPYYEMIIILNQWLSEMFPQYQVEHEIERPLNEREIEDGVRKGKFTLDESFNQIKKDVVTENGIITRIHLPNDEFKLIVNGQAAIRVSGTIHNPIPLSSFLHSLKKIDDPESIRAFIFENSREIKKIYEDSIVEITHRGIRMKNFFQVHKDYINKHGIESITNVVDDQTEMPVYRSGKFVIKFDSYYHKEECFALLKREDSKLFY